MFSPYSLEFMLKQNATLRARHLSIYAEDWPFWIGRSLADSSVTLIPPSQCEGSFEEMTPVANGARVRGWIWDRALKRVPRVIIFADEQDRIIGVALSGRDVAAGSREIDGQETGWRGHVTALYGSRTVRALALGSGHRSACEFGAIPWNAKSPAPRLPARDGSPGAIDWPDGSKIVAHAYVAVREFDTAGAQPFKRQFRATTFQVVEDHYRH